MGANLFGSAKAVPDELSKAAARMPGIPSNRSVKRRAASPASSSPVRTEIAAGAVKSAGQVGEAVTTTVSETAGALRGP